MKKIFKNLLSAICVMIYFIILNFAYTRMNTERLAQDIQVFSGTFLILGLLALEKAYKEAGIELLALSIHSLSIMHVTTLFKYDFRLYLLTSSYIFAIYYILKAIIIYTKDRKEYLKGLSDISEIVKADEPVKKEAKKRSTKKEDVKENVKDEQQKTKKIRKETNSEKNNKKTTQTKKKTTTKKISLKKDNVIKTEEKPKTTKKKNSVKKEEETSEIPKKKKTSTTTSTAKKKTTKSKKEVKEND